ncbi:unnamed protein product [Brassica oleracea var. botrytis]
MNFTNWRFSNPSICEYQLVTTNPGGVLLKGEVLGSSNATRTNNLPVDVEAFPPMVKGIGTRYQLLTEISMREREAGIKLDPEIDAFMKFIAISGQETSLVTDDVLKVMRRGVSGGQRKLLTTGKTLSYYIFSLFDIISVVWIA